MTIKNGRGRKEKKESIREERKNTLNDFEK